ncbi:MAG TPA: acyl-CoA dehydrogenase family protein [Actinophytocola sp.]|uniref:acyl-CoA dehydrogenase family protein n=1 Tax=Actinophytocola sp. TaxID=1872138 RepID=UPI002DDD95D6|nr:acyl-CoA dehydrogenase family protein [Actinophytocola sp.]HEV2784278.1 acyl-CoA dehydrogenase family protein [Actinophytocola sp.]
MNLLYTDVEDHLRSSVGDLLADRCSPTQVLARCETDKPYDLDLWRTLAADVGAAALLIPESHGGHGATAREAAVVLEELGRFVAPVPFLGSAVLATTALVGCSADTLLSALAAGESTATLAIALSMGPGSPFPSGVRVDGGTLHGRVGSVADALVADVLVVPAVGPDGPELHAVRLPDPAVTVTPVVSLDLTRPIADLTLSGATSERLAGPGAAESAVDSALRTGAGLLASEQLGLAEWCLDSTVAYLKERKQFGRPVGSFQALKHRVADVWESLVLARAAARYAADTLATGDPDTPVAVGVAASLCSPVAVRAAEECIQLHGGIGMTWEHPAHLYLKRAKADEIALGTPGRHRANLAPLINLPGPE